MRTNSLQQLGLLPLCRHTKPFVYVMCGARGELSNGLADAIPNARFVGFEPDPDAWNRLAQSASEKYVYFNVAVGRSRETRTFYGTRAPECSSLLRPNQDVMGRFLTMTSQTAVVETGNVQTVGLDTYLPTVSVEGVSFLELDTQGTELEILLGARDLLAESVVGVKIEMEFAELYQEQPLFSDVDQFLRRAGFELFDMQLYRYRREGVPRDFPTRGQLLYADAIYLADHRRLAATDHDRRAKIVLTAAWYGFHDYACEVLDRSLSLAAGDAHSELIATLRTCGENYKRRLRREGAWPRLLMAMEHIGFTRLLNFTGGVLRRGDRVLGQARAKTRFSW